MLRGIYAAASGMGVQQGRMDVISNNLANISVNGFKGSTVTSASFNDFLLVSAGPDTGTRIPPGLRTLGTMSHGAAVTAVNVDYSQGSLQETNRQLDLAITGDGFFKVLLPTDGDPGRVAYTRDGFFHRDGEGYLITNTGHRVLNTNSSPILLPEGELSITPTGVIIVGENEIDKLAIELFDNNYRPVREGNGYFTAPGQIGRQHENPSVLLGFLERSNVDPIAEMTNMLTALRAYEAGQKVIQAHDELLGKAINQVGSLR